MLTLSIALFIVALSGIAYSLFSKSEGSHKFFIFSASLIILFSTFISDGFFLVAQLLDLSDKSAPRIVVALSIAVVVFIFLFAQVLSNQSQIEHELFSLTNIQEVNEILNALNIPPKKYYVLMPAYNEEENLRTLIPDVLKNIDLETTGVIVLDDGSSDGTSNLSFADSVTIVSLSRNLGGGAAIQIGFSIAKKMGASGVITMDSDCQHKPKDLSSFIDELENGKNFIIGSRVLGSADYSSLIRTIGIKFFSWIISTLIKQRITDTSSGFRAISLKTLNSVLINQKQYHVAELIIRSAKKGFQIIEIPVSFQKRLHGETKKGNYLIYGFNYARVVLTSVLFEK